MALKLSVNLNKIALLRNSRGAYNPSPRVAAETCIKAGAHGLTLHWRQDNRHTQKHDVQELCAFAKDHGVEFNLEGDARKELVALALEIQPTQFTLVPVTPGEVTSDHGWDLTRDHALVTRTLNRIHDAGIRSAIFMDASRELMAAAAETGTQRVELYTEPYAAAFGTSRQSQQFNRLKNAAQAAAALGLGVNAGHDLDLRNLPLVAQKIPEVAEVSIGHALVADALYIGLEAAVQRYVTACAGTPVPVPQTQ